MNRLIVLALVMLSFTACSSVKGQSPDSEDGSIYFFAKDSKKETLKWEGNFMFFQMADTQLGYGKYEKDIQNFDEAIAYANKQKPEFVVICGDLLVDPFREKERDAFLEVAQKLDKSIPLHLVSGNHDVMEKRKTTAKGLKWYRDTFGKDYYSFTTKGCYGIVLNSSLIKDIEVGLEAEQAKQKAWMLEELEKAVELKAKHIFIFQHHPYFHETIDEKKAPAYFHLPNAKKEFFEIFHKYGVRAVFAGHYHRNVLGKDGDIEMITTGQLTTKGGAKPGFRVVHVFEDKIEHKYFGLKELPEKIEVKK
jgi:predicted MPP superfamily phosphohydrolase